MVKFSFSLLISFIVILSVATGITTIVLNPLPYPLFNETMREQEEGLVLPSLLSGYFIPTLMMVIGYRYFSLRAGWLKKGMIFGLIAGLMVFLSGHLIVSGWSVIPSLPMIISGKY